MPESGIDPSVSDGGPAPWSNSSDDIGSSSNGTSCTPQTDSPATSDDQSSHSSESIGERDEYESCLNYPWWKQMAHDELVIAGVSGRFPESDNMQEFADHLFNAEDMVTADNRRWEVGYYDLPARHGKLKVVNKFDAQFFGVSPKQANMLDPQLRILLEVTYEAILDAGINPTSIRGSRTGVFVGASGSETMSVTTRDPDTVSGYTAPGCFISMFANRISYTFDFKGPSFPVDTACSSSLLALQLAVDAIRQGHCDQAVVAGCSLDLTANSALQFLRFGMLSDDGKSKSFDADGRGYVRSEAVVALFIQKASNAKRIYANVVHAKSSTDGYKEAGITVPSGVQQALLLEEVYHEAGVNPKRCVYVEAHGTGTKVGDPQEAHAITEVFCKDRDTPLLIGSVKSNMGHAEPASGLCSIAKVLLAMERSVIPPNLHFSEPNPYIPGLLDGRLKVVTKPTKWARGYVGINSFGFGGANTHVLLQSNEHKPAQIMHRSDTPTIPKILCLASRTEAGVRQLFDQAEIHKDNAHFYSLLADLSNLNPNQSMYRGVAIMNRDKEQPTSVDIKKVALNSLTMSERMEATRPIWFVYSGMGSQWPGMCQQLMCLGVFKESIIKCSDALRPIGIDPYSLIMASHDGEVFKNTMHCMVCITAVQIALTDVLQTVGIVPSGIVGHSTGEMACGYADGCLSRQQTMMLAYHRGQTIARSALPGTGSMAAVGLSWEDAHRRVPKGVVCACHNGIDSVTISGETEQVEYFVDELKKEGVFAKMVNSSGVPFHSPAMQKVKGAMIEKMSKVIPKAQPRSSRWISTSVADENIESGRLCSAEYQVNNAMNPVLFYEALQQVPDHAVTIEIGPTALLAAVLRRSLPNCTNIGLLKANSPSELELLLSSIGRLYQSGLSVRVQELYECVQYPVPRGTPMISPHIAWEHSHDWMVVSGSTAGGGGGIASSVTFTIDPFASDSKEKYLLDHVIDGRPLYPFAGYILLAWRAICKLKGLEHNKTAVTLRDITVHKPTIMTKAFKLDVVVSPVEGNFEILDNGQLSASGNIQLVDAEDTFEYEGVKERIDAAKASEQIVLGPNDIYKELLLRGYEYGAQFRTLHKVWNSSGAADVTWAGNWIAYLDALLQATVFFERDDKLRLPTTLRFLRIDPILQDKSVHKDGDHSFIPIFNDRHSKECFAGGVEMSELVSMQAPRRIVHGGKVYLEKIHFARHTDDQCLKSFLTDRVRLDSHIRSLKNCVGAAWHRAKKSGMFSKCADLPLLLDGLNKLVNPSNVLVPEGPIGELFAAHLFHKNTGSSIEQSVQLVKQQMHEFPDDLLHSAGLTQRIVKPLIDIAQESRPGHLNRFGCIQPSDLVLTRNANTWATSHPLIETEWTVVAPNAEWLCEQLPDHWEKRACVFDIYSGGAVPDSVKGQCDTLLMDRVLHHSSDVPRLVQRVGELLQDQGMAIVVENTAYFELTLLLDFLKSNGRLPAPGDGNRVHGMYLKHDDWLKTFAAAGFDCVGHQTDKSLTTTAYLLHRKPKQPKQVKMVNVDDVHEFGWLPELQTVSEQAITKLDQTIWLTSPTVTDNGSVGLGFCLREEAGAKWMPYRSISNVSLKSTTPTLDIHSDSVKQIMQTDIHSNCYRDGVWGSFRHFPTSDDLQSTHPLRMCEHAYITTLTRGDLSSLRWMQSSNEYFNDLSRPDHIQLVAVYYAPLNFRDIMIATGKLTPEAIPAMFGSFADRESLLGTEFSGRRFDNGERLMGLLPGRALATSVVVHNSFVFPVPDAWTLEEASTVPVVYCTAYYALCVRGRLQPNERVLLHSGSGGVGQAAIAIALSLGCEVFTTCGSQEKREFLIKRFPGLKNDHILNSRSTQFERQIQRLTRGKGVHVVLNSLSDDKLQASLRCLSEHGRFLEIGKFDMTKNSKMGLKLFLKSVTFHGILLDALTDAANPEWQMVSRLFTEGVQTGVVRPLPTTVFTGAQVENSFRFMASGKHIGKVVVQIRPEEREHCVPRSVCVRAICHTVCHPLHVYVITGGLGGFGLELAQWLVNRGATKLVLTSRSGIKTGYQARCVDVWKKAGVTVLIDQHKMASAEDTNRLMEDCLQLGPIGGIFHLAMVLRDALLENQKIENFKEAAESKYWGTRNLDQVTRLKCPDMKWFVVFSSITAGRGNTGQTAYGWSNSTMERIVEQRRADGFSGIAIEWGAIGDVGVIIENMGNNSTVVSGTLPQRIPSCLQALDTFLSWNHPLVSSFVRADTGRKSTGAGGDILSAIAHIIGVNDTDALDLDTNLGDLGIDSLMGVEIRQVLERDHEIVLNMKDIRKLNLRKLKALADGDNSIREQLAESQDTDGASTSDDNLEMQMNKLFKLRVDVNELISYEDVVLVNEVLEGDKVFFVHSIEGIAAPIKRLCLQLQSPAYCLQATPNNPMTSIEQCATQYIQTMKTVQPKGPYRICGYSYGACIAFEMACQLQKAGVPNQVVLLDGSHHYMQTYRKAYRLAYGMETNDLTNNALFETEILCALASRFGNFDYGQMRGSILPLPDWDSRVQTVSAEVMKAGLFKNKDTFVWSCNTLRQKFSAADKFEPSYKYKGNMALVRAEHGAAKEADIGHDYGLAAAVDGSVDVYVVDGDHDTMVQGAASNRTASILNRLFPNVAAN